MTMTTARQPAVVPEDAAEQQRLYDDWYHQLLRYVHRLTGDPHTAEDVAQEALTRFLAHADRRTFKNPRAWLFRVATNLVRDMARRTDTVRRKPVPVDADHPATPAEELDRNEAIRGVRAALDRISPRDRELLIMRESGFRHREIAEVLGVKTESVPTLALRALERLRAAYRAEMDGDDEASR
jgi:RNA polymerase sigma factor (sigma-70 family)